MFFGEGQIGFDGPGVPVLRVKRGGFIVAIQPSIAVPETLISGSFDVIGNTSPIGRG